MNKKARKLFAWCLVVSMIITQMLFTNTALAATRHSGDDRYQTAIKISQNWDKAQYVVLARGDDFADALAAGPLATKFEAPLLLTESAALSAGVLDELKRLEASYVFIAGGNAAVSAGVEAELKAAGLTVERISGENRVETSVKIAEKLGAGVTEVVLASGLNYPDALSVSSVASVKGMPILLAAGSALDSDVATYITGKKVYVVGGPNAVADSVFAAAEAVADVERVYGDSRFATNKAVMEEFEADIDFSTIFLAVGDGPSGDEFADALAGSVLAAQSKSPVVLVYKTMDAAVEAYVVGKALPTSQVVVLGGERAVASSVATGLENAISDKVEKGLSIQVSVDDEDKTLTADGADNAIVTATVVRDGVVDTNFKGTIKFTSSKGATFAKDLVALNKGVAKVQVTSISSAKSILDTVIATVADAENVEDLGVSGTIQVMYVPGDQDLSAKVFLSSAESASSAEVFVKFNKDFDFSGLYEDWSDDEAVLVAATDWETEDPNFYWPMDLVKVDSRTIKMVFDEVNALPDNETISIVSLDADHLFASVIDFKLVDPRSPEAVDAVATDYRTIVAEFTEPITEEEATDWANWVLNGIQLDETNEDLEEYVNYISLGKDDDENAVVDRDEVPGDDEFYTADEEEPVDNRMFVTIQLSGAGVDLLKDTGKANLLQAYNMKDYAALTDLTGQNDATTQEFEFTTPKAPGAPTATLVIDSPEQYRVLFNTGVQNADGEDLDEANILLYNQEDEEDGEPVYADDPMVDYQVTRVEDNEYLIELTTDWTELLDTAATRINYYTPDHNTIKVVIDHDGEDDVHDVETVAGVELKKDITLEKTLSLDAVSPKINSVDAVEDEDDLNANDDDEDTVYTVVMSEPIKMAGVNDEGDTPSQKQNDTVPVPTFQFVSEDEEDTYDGLYADTSLGDYDTEFTVYPVDENGDVVELEGGKWTLYIRSISDDVGNTAETISKVFTITDEDDEPEIIAADAHDDDGGFDVVHIQFNTEMSLNALKSNIYQINGKVLPVGVKITAVDVEDVGTLVTITLPDNFFGDRVILNVSKSLTNVDGIKLTGDTEIDLPLGDCPVDVVPEV